MAGSTTTTHKVTRVGKSFQASVEHSSRKAYQFDFYVPKTIWKVRVVKDFFDALAKLGGATVFDEEIGIWKGNDAGLPACRPQRQTADCGRARDAAPGSGPADGDPLEDEARPGNHDVHGNGHPAVHGPEGEAC
jgi:hypothetical protein